MNAEPTPLFNNIISQTKPGVNTNSEQTAEPSIYDKVMETIALGQGKDAAQTVDTETQAEYDNENDVLGALDGTPKRKVGIKYNIGNTIQLSCTDVLTSVSGQCGTKGEVRHHCEAVNTHYNNVCRNKHFTELICKGLHNNHG